jgi:hypothetical protein
MVRHYWAFNHHCQSSTNMRRSVILQIPGGSLACRPNRSQDPRLRSYTAKVTDQRALRRGDSELLFPFVGTTMSLDGDLLPGYD